MKHSCRMLVIVALAGLGWQPLQSLHAQTPLPIYEPFPASYTNGTPDETVAVPAAGSETYPARRIRAGDTTAVWSIGGSPGGGSPLAVGGPTALSYPGLYQSPTPSIGAWIRTNLTTANRTAGIRFPTVNSGSIYASFLMKVETPPVNTNRCFVKFETATTGTGSSSGAGSAVGVHLTPEGRLALSKSSATVAGITNPTVLTPETHLVVVRYTWNEGTDDEVALWLNPGTLSAPPGSEPAPSITLTTGTDIPSISSFYIQAPQTAPPQVPTGIFLDEIRIAKDWATVTPTQALCITASVSTPPDNQTVTEGVGALFSVVAGGTSPNFQWQRSTNGGATWHDVSTGIGGNSPTYQTSPTLAANNGNQYRVVVTVPCNSSIATSAVATLTVNAAIPTPPGVILDDQFTDFEYNNIPVGISNSVWLQSTSDTLDASSGTHLVATSQSSSVTWLAYFTDDSVTNQPIHLDVGKQLKVTLDFKGNNIVSSGGGFRIGLFDYADGGVRPMVDGSGVANSGLNVRGYMAAINYGTTFSANPFSLYVRNNLVADLMGTTGNYIGLGGGPGGYAGAPAFQNGVTYRAEFTVTRTAVSSVTFAATITGGGTNWSHSRVDDDYAYPRFDTIGIRSTSAALAADTFEFSRVLVEVVTAAPNPIPLNVTPAAGNVTFTWSDPSFGLQAAPIVTGTYTNVPGAATGYTIPASQTQGYYRLIWPAP